MVVQQKPNLVYQWIAINLMGNKKKLIVERLLEWQARLPLRASPFCGLVTASWWFWVFDVYLLKGLSSFVNNCIDSVRLIIYLLKQVEMGFREAFVSYVAYMYIRPLNI